MGVKTYRYELVRGETLGKAYEFFDKKTSQSFPSLEADQDLRGKTVYHVEDNIIPNETMPDCNERMRHSSLVTRTVFFRDSE